jgi:hypothetical protein
MDASLIEVLITKNKPFKIETATDTESRRSLRSQI